MKQVLRVDSGMYDGAEKLEQLLNKGWEIERTDAGEGKRYILYVLVKKSDPDVGRCSNIPN